MRKPGTTAVCLAAGERSVQAGGAEAQLLVVTEGAAWVRGAERIWTPVLAGGCASWAAGERQELWSPAGMRGVRLPGAVESPAAFPVSGHRSGRSAVRIVCVNEAGRVLLWRWPERVRGGFGWLPVGGGIEPGEEPVEAARREWAEETGLDPAAVTERHVFVRRDLVWEGRRHVADEAFFLARVVGEPTPAPAVMLAAGYRWASVAEIGLLTEQFEPPAAEFAAIVAELTAAPGNAAGTLS